MAIRPDHIKRVVALNLSAEAMAEVLSIIAEASVKERSSAAEKQARYRERKAALASVTRGNETVTTGNGVTLVSPQEINSTPLPKSSLRSDLIPPVCPPAKSRRGKTPKHPLPNDWQPSEVQIQRHVERGMSRAAIAAEVETMRNWAAAQGQQRADWAAQFENWLNNKRRWDAERASSIQRQSKPTFADLLREEIDHERDCQLAPKAAAAFIIDDPFARPSDERPSACFSGPVLDL